MHAKWIARLTRLTTLHNQKLNQTNDLKNLNNNQKRHYNNFGSALNNNTAQQQLIYQQQKQQFQQQRPDSWGSDGSYSISSRSSVSVPEDNNITSEE